MSKAPPVSLDTDLGRIQCPRRWGPATESRLGLHGLQEAKVLAERWRRHYDRFPPHSSLGYRPPAPEVVEIGMPGTDILIPGVALGLI